MITTTYSRKIAAAHKNGPPDGKCYNMHGHTWEIEVNVTMPSDRLDIDTGWGIDFHILKDIIDFYDHTTLNLFTYDEEWSDGKYDGLFTSEMHNKRNHCDSKQILTWPSAEGLAMGIYLQIKAVVPYAAIEVTVFEGDHESVTYDGN